VLQFELDQHKKMADVTSTNGIWIGGILALSGTIVGLIGAFVNSQIERRAKRQQLVREKYEEMAHLISSSLAWYPQLAKCKTLDEIASTPPPLELRKILTLCILYFPEVKNDVVEYWNGMSLFYNWSVDIFSPNMAGLNLGIQAAMRSENLEKTRVLTALRQRLENTIEKNAPKYAKV